MQGTAAVVLAAAFSAVRAAGTRMRDQRVVIHGAGTAGLGIADMMRDQMVREGLSHEEATRRFWPLGSHGLLVDDRIERLLRLPGALRPPRRPRSRTGPAGGPRHGLADVVRQVHPTMLIGTSTQAGAFTEEIVRDMAAHTDAADHHAAVQPHIEVRGAARRPARAGPTAGRWSRPAARSHPVELDGTDLLTSPRPTTRSSSPASGSGSPSPGPAGSATA